MKTKSLIKSAMLSALCLLFLGCASTPVSKTLKTGYFADGDMYYKLSANSVTQTLYIRNETDSKYFMYKGVAKLSNKKETFKLKGGESFVLTAPSMGKYVEYGISDVEEWMCNATASRGDDGKLKVGNTCD